MIRTGLVRPHRVRSAFTLFEVLVALALSTLLIAATYSAFDLYVRLRIAGEDEVEQAQIARAVLQRIEADLLATIYQPSTENETTASNSSDSSSDDEIAPLVIDPADANSGGNSGLVGDATNLVLSVSLPQSHATYAAVSDGPVGLSTSDLKSVTYLLAGEGLGDLAEAVAERYPFSDKNKTGVTGLARIEGDRLMLAQADAVADVETLAAQALLLASEIKSLQFEYTDGLDWFESWDSEFYGSLPRAVRVTLSFHQPSDEAVTSEADERKVYQLVVVLPSSDPISGSSSDSDSEDEEEE